MRNLGRLGSIAVVLAGAISMMPDQVWAADALWSAGIQLGYFEPAMDQWKERYDENGGLTPSLTAGYAFTSQWVIAAEAAYFSAESQAQNANGEPSIERQKLTLIPLTLGIEYRLDLRSQQLVVPFLGVGYRRVEYRLNVSSLSEVQGGANGFTARAGFDLLLDALDQRSASGFQNEYGVAGTYLRFEAQWAEANAPATPDPTGAPQPDIDLGGKTFLLGLRFAF